MTTRQGRTHCYQFSGLVAAAVMFCLSLTPSLLPRGYLYQGLISGLLTAVGYGLGVLTAWLGRQIIGRPLPEAGPRAWRILLAAATVAGAISVYAGARWQTQIHQLIDLDPPPRVGYLLVPPIAVVTAAAWVGLARLLRQAARWIAALLGRWIPAALVVHAFASHDVHHGLGRWSERRTAGSHVTEETYPRGGRVPISGPPTPPGPATTPPGSCVRQGQ
ncbi:hypothetical protein GCM10010112_92540 [Actinoplanes lobatus]|uniref:Putative membrane protein n=1 Tax=Actinoplanes lobatus TaxID=113568 RepID=A0A7W7HL07_9ACTN|nr:alpha/beta-hydrolase N-terminal domain-containing protein [Actinoplanes lobatus]MBB4752496.1 putative membrane protein [Actinoplanes lobatus]GGN99070.1 hypothetical protein GCM10010112_92540 [Actinoplanes lobatus]GIE46283.1 hypothetical protein Alo02nite_91810 [Actinoplanes lobatus]